MLNSNIDRKEDASPIIPGSVSQSLIIKKSLYYFGMESPHQANKFDQFEMHPLYKFPVVSRGKSDVVYINRSSFTIADKINIKQTLIRLHQQSPFSNSHSLREIIQESSLGFHGETGSISFKPPYQLYPYQSSVESFDFSDLSVSASNHFSRTTPQGRIQTPITYALDSRKEATVDTGLSFSSIKSDEVIYNSDNLELSRIE